MFRFLFLLLFEVSVPPSASTFPGAARAKKRLETNRVFPQICRRRLKSVVLFGSGRPKNDRPTIEMGTYVDA